MKIHTFLAVVRLKSFSRAADVLNITQPAVSQQIKALEQQFSVKLIKKGGRHFELTEEGKIIFAAASKVELFNQKLKRQLIETERIKKTFYIGASMTIGNYVLPYILGEYQKSNSDRGFNLLIDNTERIVNKVLEETVDLGIIEGASNNKKIIVENFISDEMVMAVGQKSTLDSKKGIFFENILKEKLILRENGSGTRSVFIKSLAEKGYREEDLKIFMEVGSLNAIISMVEAGLGSTVISRRSIRKELKLGTIREIPFRDNTILRDFKFIYTLQGNIEYKKAFISYCKKLSKVL